MIELQTIANSLISHINAATGKDGEGIAVTSKGGHFLLLFGDRMGGEFARVMPTDDKGEFYYIRLKTGQVDEATAPKKRGSCNGQSRITARCRLVAMSHCDTIATLAYNMRSAVSGYRNRYVGETLSDATTSVNATVYDFATIVTDEVPEASREDVSGWEGGMSIIAIDFDLSFTAEACSTAIPVC